MIIAPSHSDVRRNLPAACHWTANDFLAGSARQQKWPAPAVQELRSPVLGIGAVTATSWLHLIPSRPILTSGKRRCRLVVRCVQRKQGAMQNR